MTKYEVNPLVKISTCIVTLQRLSIPDHIISWTLSPWWQGHVINLLIDMIETQLHIVEILEKETISQIELRYEFFVVSQYLHTTSAPRESNVMEDSIRRSSISLVLNLQNLRWNLSNQIVQDNAWC